MFLEGLNMLSRSYAQYFTTIILLLLAPISLLYAEERNSVFFTDYIEGDHQFGTTTVISGDTLAISQRANFFDKVYIHKDKHNINTPTAVIMVPGLGPTSTIALDDNILAIGKIAHNNYRCGIVYVYEEVDNIWTLIDFITPDSVCKLNSDGFGASISIDGDTIVIGAYGEDSNSIGTNGDQDNDLSTDSGAVYVYKRNGNSWIQETYLKASNPDSNDRFGSSVSIQGDTIVVGAYLEDGDGTSQTDNSFDEAGAVYIFEKNEGAWTQMAYLKAANPGEGYEFGNSVDIYDSSIVIGSYFENGEGAAYVFNRNPNSWSQEAYLKASNPGMYDRFGTSVDIYSNFILIGASYEDSNSIGVNNDGGNNLASDSGAAYLFERKNNQWQFSDYIKASNTTAVGLNELFGNTVAVGDNFITVGTVFANSVYFYSFDNLFMYGFEPPPTPPPSVEVYALLTTIDIGGLASIFWTISNDVTSCLKLGDWSGQLSDSEITNGTHTTLISNITSNSTYIIRCENDYGSSQDSVSILVE